MVVHVFMSHTKLDEEFCNRFDIAAARVGVSVFRSEFETMEPPAWKTIKNKMGASSAMFLLVGKELVKAQSMADVTKEARELWKHTQNWIAYEVGLACEKGIDVWVMCDLGVEINFPVPYFNNYTLFGFGGKKLKFLRGVLKRYSEEKRFPIGIWERNLECPNRNCGSEFNLHSVLQKKDKIVCPTCLKGMTFEKGWLLDTNKK